MRADMSPPFENRFESDVWDKEGLFCIIVSIDWERIDTSEARYAVHCAGSSKS